MSERARHVLWLIDQAEIIRERHPTLHAAQLRAGEKTGRDRTCLQLAHAVAQYQRHREPVATRAEHDDVERVDASWEEAEAREREEHDRGRRLRLNTNELTRRRTRAGLELIREVLDQAAAISTVPAGNIAPSRGGGTPDGVPTQQRLDDDPRWKLADGIIKRQALILLELIDEARGFSRAGAVAALSEEEKNQTLREEGVGLTAEHLFHRVGPEYGSITFIRRWRKTQGLDARGRDQMDS